MVVSGRPGFWLLAAVVVLAHLLLGNRLAEGRAGWGAGDALPPRIDVTFVRELAPATPPAMTGPLAMAERRLAAVAAPQVAASAPAAGPAELAPPSVLASAPSDALPVALPDPVPEPASPASAAVPAPLPPTVVPVPDPAPALPIAAQAAPAVLAASVPMAGLSWPPSTQLRYRLLGHYRGPVEGSAQVEWLREGSRYQVHLSTSIGPVMSRRITSEGEITAQGLAPRRFDGEQKVLFRSPRRWQLRFGPEQVVLTNGQAVPTLPGAQDEASQFVQLTWLFTTQPDKLRVGGAVEMPLAISRKLERWIYDVAGQETLRFPFGEVPTFHLKPRRAASAGDLSAEIWIAPTLQYLPVRIRITDGKDSWVDLTLEAPPLQAATAN